MTLIQLVLIFVCVLLIQSAINTYLYLKQNKKYKINTAVKFEYLEQIKNQTLNNEEAVINFESNLRKSDKELLKTIQNLSSLLVNPYFKITTGLNYVLKFKLTDAPGINDMKRIHQTLIKGTPEAVIQFIKTPHYLFILTDVPEKIADVRADYVFKRLLSNEELVNYIIKSEFEYNVDQPGGHDHPFFNNEEFVKVWAKWEKHIEEKKIKNHRAKPVTFMRVLEMSKGQVEKAIHILNEQMNK